MYMQWYFDWVDGDWMYYEKYRPIEARPGRTAVCKL
jgi:hypothetical protein